MKYAMHVEISQIFEVVDIINNNLVSPNFFFSLKNIAILLQAKP